MKFTDQISGLGFVGVDETTQLDPTALSRQQSLTTTAVAEDISVDAVIEEVAHNPGPELHRLV